MFVTVALSSQATIKNSSEYKLLLYKSLPTNPSNTTAAQLIDLIYSISEARAK